MKIQMVSDRWVYVSTTYFTAGLSVDDNGYIVNAAPIISWTVGKHKSKVFDYFQKRGTLVEWKEQDKEGLWINGSTD